jgi:hypothetical protein
VIIPIVYDTVLESNEIFQVEIDLLNNEDRTCVALQPNIVDVVIVDDDSELKNIYNIGNNYGWYNHI